MSSINGISPFLNLPTELRSKIYNYVVSSDREDLEEERDRKGHSGEWRYEKPPRALDRSLILTNRSIYREAAPIHYRISTVKLDPRTFMTSINNPAQLMRHVGRLDIQWPEKRDIAPRFGHQFQTRMLEEWTALREISLCHTLGVDVRLSPFGRYRKASCRRARRIVRHGNVADWLVGKKAGPSEHRLEFMQNLLPGVKTNTRNRDLFRPLLAWQKAQPHERVLKIGVHIDWEHRTRDNENIPWTRGVSLPLNCPTCLSSKRTALTPRQQELVFEKEQPKLIVWLGAYDHHRYTVLYDGSLLAERWKYSLGKITWHTYIPMEYRRDEFGRLPRNVVSDDDDDK